MGIQMTVKPEWLIEDLNSKIASLKNVNNKLQFLIYSLEGENSELHSTIKIMKKRLDTLERLESVMNKLGIDDMSNHEIDLLIHQSYRIRELIP